MTNNELRLIILDIKEKHSLTNKGIANWIGKHEQSIKNYSLGYRYPNEETIQKLIDLLELDEI